MKAALGTIARSTVQWTTIIAFFLFAGGALAAGALDGKVFIGEAGEKGKPADEKDDVISFVDGRFHSSACDKYGFNKAAYTTRTEGDATYFEAETVSEKEGKLKWTGVLRGNKLEGTFVHHRKPAWYRPNPDPVEHWFNAKPK